MQRKVISFIFLSCFIAIQAIATSPTEEERTYASTFIDQRKGKETPNMEDYRGFMVVEMEADSVFILGLGDPKPDNVMLRSFLALIPDYFFPSAAWIHRQDADLLEPLAFEDLILLTHEFKCHTHETKALTLGCMTYAAFHMLGPEWNNDRWSDVRLTWEYIPEDGPVEWKEESINPVDVMVK